MTETNTENNILAKNLLAKVLRADFKSGEFDKLDLTHNQKTVLQHLILSESSGIDLSMTELSNLLDITKSATSQTVAKLERKGVVRRKWARGDRRRILVHLTAKGKAMADAFFADIVAFIETRLDKLDEDEKQILVRIFDKCID